MAEVQFQLHPDGRRAFPAVVQYRVGDSVLDLPPTAESQGRRAVPALEAGGP